VLEGKLSQVTLQVDWAYAVVRSVDRPFELAKEILGLVRSV